MFSHTKTRLHAVQAILSRHCRTAKLDPPSVLRRLPSVRTVAAAARREGAAAAYAPRQSSTRATKTRAISVLEEILTVWALERRNREAPARAIRSWLTSWAGPIVSM